MNKNGDRNRHGPGSILDCAQFLFQLPQNQHPIPPAARPFSIGIRLFEHALAPDPDVLPLRHQRK
jgi:hypothetical protein